MRSLKASIIDDKSYLIRNEEGFQVMKVVRDEVKKNWVLMTLRNELIASAKSRFLLFSMYNIRVVEFVWPKMFDLTSARVAA